MNDLIYRAVLLAQRGRLDSWSREFRGRRARIDAADVGTTLLLLAGAVLVIWLMYYFLRRQERRGGHVTSAMLFLSLCRAHRLRWSQQWLLWRVARARQMSNPAQLFLEPQRLERAGLGPALQSHATQLDGLRKKLFSVPKPEKKKPKADPPKTGTRDQADAPPSPIDAGPNLDVPPWTKTPDAVADIETQWQNWRNAENV